jgi:hypothetical protein
VSQVTRTRKLSGYDEARRSTLVLLQDAADLPVHRRRRHQHSRRLRPGDALLPDGKQSLAMFAAIVKKLRVFGTADQMPCHRPRFEATTFTEFAEMRHRLLNDATANPHAAHQPPNSGEPSRSCELSCAADTCAESTLTRSRPKIALVGTTRSKSAFEPTQLLDLIRPLRQNDFPFGGHFAQVGLI